MTRNFSFPITRNCTVCIYFSGPITQSGMARLIAFLKLSEEVIIEEKEALSTDSDTEVENEFTSGGTNK